MGIRFLASRAFGIGKWGSICLVVGLLAPSASPERTYDPPESKRGRPTPDGNQLLRGFVEHDLDGRTQYLARDAPGGLLLQPEQVTILTPSGNSHLRFVGGRRTAPRGVGRLPGRINRFVGDKRQWIVGARRYARVVYEDVYPGVDAVFRTKREGFEYDFMVAPGADPSLIRLRFDGPYHLDPTGDLLLGSSVVHEKPRSHQSNSRALAEIPSEFHRFRNGDIGFRVQRYDPDRLLVIDPVIRFSTYWGGSTGSDRANGVAVDRAGNAYIAGLTYSANFPTSGGAFRRSLGGAIDAFVAKFGPDGRLQYATYVGGSPNQPYQAGGEDEAFDVAVDDAGRAWITGFTSSDDFPLQNAFQPQKPGAGTGSTPHVPFVAALNPEGSSLYYSSFLGSEGAGEGIAIAPGGGAIVAGTADGIPTVNAYQSQPAGMVGHADAFVTKFSPAGDRLEFSTYLGGSSDDGGNDVAVDTSGNVFVTGSTLSEDFPVTPGAFQQQNRSGSYDAFVAKFSATGSLVYSTYLGGEDIEEGHAVDVDPEGRAVVAGQSWSFEFPLRDAFKDWNDGLDDGFITRMTGDGSGVVFSTYYGSTGHDIIYGLDVDAQGGIHVAGLTGSGNLYLRMPSHERPTDLYDAFIATFSSRGELRFGTLLGGTPEWTGLVDEEHANGIAFHGGSLYVAGQTRARDFPLLRPAQGRLAGGEDAFLTRLVPRNPIARHRVRVTMRMHRHLVFKGRLIALDGFRPCQRRRRIVHELWGSNRRWIRGAALITDRRGRYRLKYPDYLGRYRWAVDSALVKANGKWHACLPARSVARRHSH